ncbi:MAG: SatD family protein [Cyclobacteriaceae bacterium]|nr:SatD family protein [Cyclobacteriaceae bacterium]MDX5466482.1 SatD family protein [Cyclobacteriaceae bacterium]
MIAVLKGDIIHSRKLSNPEPWLVPLQDLFGQWGDSPKNWDLVWGDFFQLEIPNPEEALHKTIQIKALIKKVQNQNTGKISSPVDVRMAIGIGEKTYSGAKIGESSGSAFVFSSERFDRLKKDRVNLAIQSPWKEFDNEMNLFLDFAGIIMDNWSVYSAELMEIVLNHSDITQTEIGEILGIKQNSVSGRWNRAHVDKLLKLEELYRLKFQQLLT